MARETEKPTQYPGVKSRGNGTFRLRGKVRHAKTGELLHLDKITEPGEAKDPHEANRLRAQLLADLSQEAQRHARARPTVKAHATSWLASKLPRLKPSTQELYATIIDEYIVPGVIDDQGTQLGDCYVDAVTADDLVQWRDRQMLQPTKYGTLPRPASVNGRIAKLKEIFRAAVHDLGLDRDPTLRLEPVREGKKRKNSLSAEELARFLAAAREHTPAWYPFFFALAFSGLRFGELTAIRWRDIDEARMRVRIEGAQWKGIEDTTKVEDDGRDYVPLFSEFVDVLKAHRERQLADRKRKAKRERVIGIDALTIGDDELVFVAPRSRRHMHNTAPRKALLKALKAAGIERRFTVHGHRHTLNNLLRQETRDPTLVRSILGHAEGDGTITDRYSDVALEERRQAAQVVHLRVAGGNQSGNHGR